MKLVQKNHFPPCYFGPCIWFNYSLINITDVVYQNLMRKLKSCGHAIAQICTDKLDPSSWHFAQYVEASMQKEVYVKPSWPPVTTTQQDFLSGHELERKSVKVSVPTFILPLLYSC